MPVETQFTDFTFTGFTPTLNIKGNAYQFDLGTLPPNSTGTITILSTLAVTLTEEYVFTNEANLSGFIINTQVTSSSSADMEINLPPFVDMGLDQVFNVGEAYVLTALFSDVGLDDTHLALINWGDGTITPGLIDELAGTVTGSHTYTNAGIYEVTVTVSDNDGGINSDFAFFTVVSTDVYLPIITKP